MATSSTSSPAQSSYSLTAFRKTLRLTHPGEKDAQPVTRKLPKKFVEASGFLDQVPRAPKRSKFNLSDEIGQAVTRVLEEHDATHGRFDSTELTPAFVKASQTISFSGADKRLLAVFMVNIELKFKHERPLGIVNLSVHN